MHAKLSAIKPLKICLILGCKKMTNTHGLNGETFNGTNILFKKWPWKILKGFRPIPNGVSKKLDPYA